MKEKEKKANAPVGYFRRAGAARYLGVSVRTIGEFQRRHIVPFAKISSRCVLFKREDLDKAIERFRVACIGEGW